MLLLRVIPLCLAALVIGGCGGGEAAGQDGAATSPTEDAANAQQTAEWKVVHVDKGAALASTYPSMSMPGSHDNWSPGATVMHLVAANMWETALYVPANTEFKFAPYANWSVSFGDNDKNGFADENGTNIHIYDAGNYLVRFNDRTKFYAIAKRSIYGQVYFRGTPNNWDASTKMQLTDDYTWQLDIDTGAATHQEFKFDIDGDWITNFGDNNVGCKSRCVGEKDGANIMIPDGAGRVTVSFNDKTKGYSITKKSGSNRAPVARIQLSAKSINLGDSVVLNGAGSSDADGTIAGYKWSNGATTAQTTITPATVGNQTVSLTVKDDKGATNTTSEMFTVNAVVANMPPVANAGADVTITVGSTVTFDGSKSSDADGTIATYSWSNGLSGAKPVSAPYTMAGKYTVTLTVADNKGATASDSMVLTVLPNANQAPVARIQASSKTINLGQTVTLNGAGSSDSDGTIASYKWSNGAATPQTTITPTAVGTQLVSLSVTDDKGATNTASEMITVNAVIANMPPVANAGADVTIIVGSAVTFDGSKSMHHDGTIANYAWSNGLVGVKPVSSPYNTVGNYTVTLTVTDNKGATATDSVIVTVNAKVNQSPVAKIQASSKTINLGETVTLSGAGSSDSDGTIASYKWSNGAITPQTTITPTAAGSQTVSLTVTDDKGATNTASEMITVNAVTANMPPVANAGADVTIVVGSTVTFDGSKSMDSDGTIANYTWSNGLAGVKPVSTPYNAVGSYTITLTVADDKGATAIDSMVVTVIAKPNQAPIANAGADVTIIAGNTVTFDASKSTDPDGVIANYQWNNGLAGVRPTSIPYNTAGSYTVILTVTDDKGATATDSMVVTVTAKANLPPVANAGVDVSIVAGDSVTFDGSKSSDADGTIASYKWSNGLTGVKPVSSPYNAAGSYVVTLTVTDDKGATATDSMTITVNAYDPAGKTSYDQQCAGCHGSSGQGNTAPSMITSSFNTLAALTTKIDNTMPPGATGSCDAACSKRIAGYIIAVFQTNKVPASACTDYKPGPRLLRLLTRREYNNTLRDMFKATSMADILTSSNSPSEVLSNGYRNNAAMNAVTDAHVRAYLSAGKMLVANASVNLRALLPASCTTNDCFVTEFGKRAFRRVLTTSEKANYLALMNSYGDKAVVRAFLMSPYYLYRSELGTDPDGDGTYDLTQYEVASALSYQLLESMPDETLLTKAGTAGALDQSAEIKAEADRLFALAQSSQALASFAQQYLEIDTLPNVAKDDAAFTPAIRQAMIKESETFFSNIVKSSNSSFRELLTASYTYGDATLASFYGLTSSGGVINYTGAQAQRSGILGQGALLAIKSPADESSPASPIRRGKFVRERMLCQALPPPPPNVNTTIPPAQAGQTTRERLAIHLSQGLQANGTNACESCHKYIDPNGFAFENFDPVGKYRTTYKLANNATIDPSGTIINVESLSTPSQNAFANLREMAQIIADTQSSKSCFAKHYYIYARGYDDTSNDQCTLEQLTNTFASSGYKIRDMMIGVTQSLNFIQRR